MEWFKSCRTNVHMVEDLFNIRFHVYQAEKEIRKQELFAAIATLRRQGVLCDTVKDDVWVFSAPAMASKQVLLDQLALSRVDEESLEANISKSAADGRLVQDVFLASIEGALSSALAGQHGMLHLGAWTWLLRSTDEDLESDAILLQLHIKLTDTGTLYATTTTKAANLHALNEDHEPLNETVYLAPSGRRAQLVLEAPDRGISSGERAKVQLPMATDHRWMLEVVQLLNADGIELEEEIEWLHVQLDFGATNFRFVWPAQLCVATVVRKYASLPDQRDWRPWFAATDDETGFRNPLAVAEEWFTTAEEREKSGSQVLSVPAAEGSTTTATVASTISPEVSSVLATSPPFVQRMADQQAAMSGIYPTPPDGLLPGSAGQPPTSDTTVQAVQAESSGSGNDLLPTSDDTALHFQRSESSVGPQVFQTDSDDLFGDMGDIDFGANEVDDADFSFFDEPDDVPIAAGGGDRAMAEVELLANDPGYEAMKKPRDGVSDAALPDEPIVPPTPIMDSEDGAEQGIAIAAENTYAANTPRAAHQGDNVSAFDQLPKPLSPLGIKERLLPPPIPASLVRDEDRTALKLHRSSTFDPVIFRGDLDLGSRFTRNLSVHGAPVHVVPSATDISLPPERKKSRMQRPYDSNAESTDTDSVSEDDLDHVDDSESSVSDEGLPPKLPWDTRKRKRTAQVDPLSDSVEKMWSDEDTDHVAGHHPMQEQLQVLIMELTMFRSGTNTVEKSGYYEVTKRRTHERIDDYYANSNEDDIMPPMDDVFGDLTKLDLVYIAQLIVDQAITCTNTLAETLDTIHMHSEDDTPTGSAMRRLSQDTLELILPEAKSCDVSSLALVREPPGRSTSTPTSARPPQHRPLQRSDNVTPGPDIFPIPPPSIRVQRGSEIHEMLPPALNFWEMLSLAPSGGPKDVRAFCVFPFNDDLQKLVHNFLGELSSAYESCRLGSHGYVRKVVKDNDLDGYENGLVPAELTSGMDDTVKVALQAYRVACADLGNFLSGIRHLEPERTIVVYMINPFRHSQASHYLCACFWELYKAFRDNVPKTHRGEPHSDIVLQILPIGLVASGDTLATLNAKQLGNLAREVYDRCPPARSDDVNLSSALPSHAAPFVELASLPPKRIGFQLAAEPPSDLLHEGSILHLAYCFSQDKNWLAVSWMDGTARYSSSMTFCVSGKSFAEIVRDVWEYAFAVLAARNVLWRVFILTIGDVSHSFRKCWREVTAARSRRQPFSVTLLSADLDLPLQLLPPTSNNNDSDLQNASAGAGFLTPATTPQGATFTVSPDTTGLSNAPPTPAPSDSVAVITDNDADAHLVELADESWGALLAAPLAESELAKGALFKRGEGDSEGQNGSGDQLPCLGLSLLWAIQVRPNGAVDEGNGKQAEMTLREVLRLYRNLSVLTRARGLMCASRGDVLPVHLAAALKGAEGVNGFPS